MKNYPSSKTVPDFLHEEPFRSMEGVLDEEPSWVLRKLIGALSAKVTVDEYVVRLIRELAEFGPVIYAMKLRSAYDLLFLRIRFAQLGLPPPAFVFGMSALATGSPGKVFRVWRNKTSALLRGRSQSSRVDLDLLKDILDKGGAGVMFLVDEDTYSERYLDPFSDPLRMVLDLQGRLAGCISIVPLFILYDRTPRKVIRPFWETLMGDPDRPGPLKRLVIALRKWTAPELLAGEPVHLLSELEEFGSDLPWDMLPFEIRKQLINAVDARIRVNRGPVRKSKTEIKELVLRDPRVQQTVMEIASETNEPTLNVRKKARSYLDEIAADQSIHPIHFWYYLLKWLFSVIFDGIDYKPEHFEELKRLSARGSVILMPCHKSHIDYLLHGWLQFVNRMAVPHMAAGKNLSFWPIGPLLRKTGAFFIRRTFKGVPLYKEVFSAYVKVMIKEEFSLGFYLEGGRSRTGKLMPPRLGMLGFMLQTVDDGAVDDLLFLPTFLGYDQIPEETDYLRELAGRKKKKESLGEILRARKVLKKSYGKVYLRFPEALSYSSFRDKWTVIRNQGNAPEKGDRRLLNDFAYHIMHGIARAGVVLPTDLASTALICRRNHRVPRVQVLEDANRFLEILRELDLEISERLNVLEDGLQTALDMFQLRGFIQTESFNEAGAQTLYTINEQKRVNLEFYRNSLVNYLWPVSLLAMVLMQEDPNVTEVTSAKLTEFSTLKSILSTELILDPLKSDEAIVEETLSLFRGYGRLEPGGQEEGRSGRTEIMKSMAGVMADFVELYHLALETLEGFEGASTQKELTKKMTKAAQGLQSEDNTRPALSVSSLVLRNALTRFAEMGLIDYMESKKISVSSEKSGELSRLKDCLSRARATYS
ncbi:1-acyl-sn-glycerol-3-phosphate acyltransferase [Thermodesulfobacteriota bacterium]